MGDAVLCGPRINRCERSFPADVSSLRHAAGADSAGVPGRTTALVPCPGSLLFWGVPGYHHLQHEYPFSLQVPLQQRPARARRRPVTVCASPNRAGCTNRIRRNRRPTIPNSLCKNTYLRTHRWAKIHRHEDELSRCWRKEKPPARTS